MHGTAYTAYTAYTAAAAAELTRVLSPDQPVSRIAQLQLSNDNAMHGLHLSGAVYC